MCALEQSGLETNFIGRIIEFFEKEDKSEWFGVQWFFRTFDTVSSKNAGLLPSWDFLVYD